MAEVTLPPGFQLVDESDRPLTGLSDTINGRDPNAPPAQNPLRDMLMSAAYPTSLGDFFGLLLPSAIGEGAVTAPLRAYAKAASTAYKRTGTLKSVPIGMMKELYWTAFGKPANGARLVKNPTNEFVAALNELRSADTLNDAAEVVGTAAKKASATGVNVNPATVSTRSGPMTATLPDKRGLTALQPPDLARVAPNSAWTTSKLPTHEQIENLRQLLLNPMADKDPVLRAQVIEAINALKGTK